MMNETVLPYRYRMFGLHVASCMPLPAQVAEFSEADVHIHLGEVPHELPEYHTEGVLYQAAPGRFLFSVEGVARSSSRWQGNCG